MKKGKIVDLLSMTHPAFSTRSKQVIDYGKCAKSVMYQVVDEVIETIK